MKMTTTMMSDIRDQIQELAHEYDQKMKANDLRIEDLQSQNRTYDAIRGQLQAIIDNEDRGSSVEVRDGQGNVIYGTTQDFEYECQDEDALDTSADRFRA